MADLSILLEHNKTTGSFIEKRDKKHIHKFKIIKFFLNHTHHTTILFSINILNCVVVPYLYVTAFIHVFILK